MAKAPISEATESGLPAGPAELGDELWNFAVSFYGGEGVADACLALQEGIGVDVNILIFALFAQLQHRIHFNMDDLTAIDGEVRDWRIQVVDVLRRVRIRLKTGSSPTPCLLTEQLRARVKAAELEAEHIELSILAKWLSRRPARHDIPPVDSGNVLRLVARYFLGGQDRDTTEPAVDRAFRRLLAMQLGGVRS